MSEATPEDRGGPPIGLIVGFLSVIVLLLAVLIGVLLQRRFAQVDGGQRLVEAAKTEAAKTEAAKTEAAKTEAAKTEAAKTEAAKTEAAKTEAVKTEAVKTPGRVLDPAARERDLNRRHERDTLETELSNQLINARSQVVSASARLRDRDPQGALADLLEAERILGDLPRLAEDFSRYNTKASNLARIKQAAPKADRILVSILRSRARARRMQGTPKALTAAREALEAALERAGKDAKVRRDVEADLGDLRVALGDRAAGEKLLSGVLKADPRHVAALLALAALRERAGKLDDAAKLLERAASADPRSLRAQHQLGELWLRAGKFGKAQRVFNRVLQRKGGDFTANLGRGRAQLGLGMLKEARADLTEAIDISPSLPHGYYHRGRVELKAGRLNHAVKDFEVARSRDARFLDAALGLGRAFLLLGLDVRAERELRRAARDPRLEVEAHARLAWLLVWRADPILAAARSVGPAARRGLLQKARAELARAQKRAPQDPLVTWVARRLANEQATHPEASEAAQHLLEAGRRERGLAERTRRGTHRQAAQSAYSLAWVCDPTQANALLEFAELESDWRGYQAALLAARAAVKADPKLLGAHLLLGEWLGHRLPADQRDRAQALTSLGVVLRQVKAPGRRLRALLAVGRTHRAAGDPGAAREALARAAKEVPTDLSLLGRSVVAAFDVVEEWQAVCKELKDTTGAKRAAAVEARWRSAGKALAAGLLTRAKRARDRLRYPEAIKILDEAVRLDPTFDEAIYLRGTCYLKVGNFVPGILDFGRSLELNPRIAGQVFNKVYQISYVVDLNRVVAELTKIWNDNPGASHVIFLRGFFYVAALNVPKAKKRIPGAVEKGIADFDETLRLNPKHVTAFNYRGLLRTHAAAKVSSKKKREALFNEALTDLRRAKQLDPKNGVSCYLEAYLLLRRAEGQPPATAEGMQEEAVQKLQEAFQLGFKGRARIKSEPAFAPIRNHPDVRRLLGR